MLLLDMAFLIMMKFIMSYRDFTVGGKPSNNGSVGYEIITNGSLEMILMRIAS